MNCNWIKSDWGKILVFVAITTLIGLFPPMRYTYGRITDSLPKPYLLGHGPWHFDLVTRRILVYFIFVGVFTFIGTIILGKKNLKLLPVGILLAILQFILAVKQFIFLSWLTD